MSADATTTSRSDIQKVMERLEDCITGIDHIAIAVEDIAEAVDWYTNKLGFKLIEERVTHGRHTSMASAVIGAGRAVLVLIQGLTPDSQVTRFIEHFGPGAQHIALGVRDMDEAMERVFEAGGATDTPMIEDVGIRQAFLRRDEGSGVRVELIERKGGQFSDESVQQLYQAFEDRELY